MEITMFCYCGSIFHEWIDIWTGAKKTGLGLSAEPKAQIEIQLLKNIHQKTTNAQKNAALVNFGFLFFVLL